MFVTPDQAKFIFNQLQKHCGTGGFEQGTVTALNPLSVSLSDRLPIPPSCLYVTENCIGLTLKIRHKHSVPGIQTETVNDHQHPVPAHETEEMLLEEIVLREPLKIGDQVLLLRRPKTDEKQESRYIVLDRIQEYMEIREVLG